MPRSTVRDPIYRRRRYTPEIIELCVRWYLTYRLSYRDLVAMMAERDVTVSHTTVMRWVQRYVPEFKRRWARFAKPTGTSWRMDETAVSVRGQSNYLYRAVDRDGKSIHSLLCKDRRIGSAQEFFRQAALTTGSIWPEKVNIDGNFATHLGLGFLGDEDSRWRSIEVRKNRYLNNMIEQDHRAIKQRCAPMLGLKSFQTAAVTLSGIELAHRIRKRQFAMQYENHGQATSLKKLWDQALSDRSCLTTVDNTTLPLPHQNSNHRQTARGAQGRTAKADFGRCQRMLSFGHSLYLLTMPSGGQYWRLR